MMRTFFPRLAMAIALSTTCVAAPALAQEVSAGNTQQVASTYRIYPGDEIEVYVWGEERLQRTVKVLPDGTMAFPLVGQISAAGLTLAEVENVVTERLAPEYRGEVPRVTASIVASSGTQFSVMGRVNSPGAFTPTRQLNVLEALALAGGPSEFANLDDVLVLRKENGTIVPYRVNVSRLFKSNVRASHVEDANILTMQPGDTIIVP